MESSNVVAQARFAGHVPLSGNVGFMLPILTDGVRLFVQEVDEWQGVVARFAPIECAPGDLTSFGGADEIRVGDAPIFVFVDPDAGTFAGKLETIGAALLDHADRNDCTAEIRLQIYEMLGSEAQKRSARADLQRIIAQSLGEEAGRLFRNASLRMELWRILLSRAPTCDDADHVTRLRARLMVWVRGNGSVGIDLTSLQPELHSWIDERQIREELSMAFDLSTVQVGLVDELRKVSVPRSVDTLLAHLASVPRQEERTAILLKAMSDDPTQVERILKTYRPRTLFETRVFDVFNRYLGERPKNLSWSSLVELCVAKIFQHVFPRHKGRFLFFIAAYLGDRPGVADFVRVKTIQSQSGYVTPFVDDIFIALERHMWDARPK